MNGIRYEPLINGAEPAWSNIVINIAGFVETGITAINYSDEQEKENIYGAGQRPVSRGYGKIECSGSLTLLRSAIENIRQGSPTGRLGDIAPFDIIIQFIPVQGGTIITHKLRNCEFRTDSLDCGRDDVENETQLELIISHIEWN